MDNNDAESSESEGYTESISDEHYHDSVERGNDDNVEYSDEEDKEAEGENRPRPDLVLDLRNPSQTICLTIGNMVKSDDETSEELSAVIEQPEDEHRVPETTLEEAGTHENSEKTLRERIRTLQDGIVNLREELKQEVALWRKERDEFQILRERSDIHALEEANAAARAAAEAYAAESPLSNELRDVVDLNPVQSLSELTILEYEKKLAKYQDALALAQAEKRYNMRRQLIANTYRQRLAEVERLCNEELENIRQNASTLQPLRQMASQWCINDDGNHGDVARSTNVAAMSFKCTQKLGEIAGSNQGCKLGNVDAEVNMIPELVAARFSYAESSMYERQCSAIGNAEPLHSHMLTESNSLPLYLYASPS